LARGVMVAELKRDRGQRAHVVGADFVESVFTGAEGPSDGLEIRLNSTQSLGLTP